VTASTTLLTIASAPDNHSIVRTVICTVYLGSVKCRLLQFGQGLSRHVLAGEIDARAHRALEMLARDLRLSECPRYDARVILDLGIAGQLRRAVPEQPPRALVDAAEVENPAQRVGDIGIVGRAFFGDLGQLERALLVAP